MAKKRTKRERPTLATIRVLRATIEDLQGRVNRSTVLLSDIQEADRKVLERAIRVADDFSEIHGILHSLLDELGKDYATALSNKARRILGRPEVQLKSTIQRVLEQHARVHDEVALAN